MFVSRAIRDSAFSQLRRACYKILEINMSLDGLCLKWKNIIEHQRCFVLSMDNMVGPRLSRCNFDFSNENHIETRYGLDKPSYLAIQISARNYVFQKY